MALDQHPPQWPQRLLETVCRPDLRDEIIGDLHEAFQWRLSVESPSKARSRFIWETFLSLKPQNLRTTYTLSINTMIFRNYLKVTSRNLRRRKTPAIINILGLAMGITAFLLIFLYTFRIFTFDDMHVNKERIHLVYKERITPDGTQPTYDTWVPMSKRLKADYPSILSASSVYSANAKVIKKDQFIDEEIVYADQDFFDLFSYEIIQGQPDQVLPDRRSLAISQSHAGKYFGKEDPMGQLLEIFLQEEDTTISFRVSAVIADFAENTSINPHMVILWKACPFTKNMPTVGTARFWKLSSC